MTRYFVIRYNNDIKRNKLKLFVHINIERFKNIFAIRRIPKVMKKLQKLFIDEIFQIPSHYYRSFLKYRF